MKIWTYKFMKNCIEKAQQYDKYYDECAEWKAKYYALTEDRITYTGGAVIISVNLLNALSDKIKNADKREEELLQTIVEKEREIKHWQEKYADEVQKRLGLIEQINM